MGRYSFSPPVRESEEIFFETQWRENDDSTSSDVFRDDSESSISSDNEEEEYPHPLGFPSYGKTRFFLDPPVESAQLVRRRLGFLKDDTDDFLDNDDWQRDTVMQSFPPLSTYVDPKTAPTQSLLSFSSYNERPEQEDDLDGITKLLSAARIVEQDENSPQYSKLVAETQEASQLLLEMSTSAQRQLQSIRQDMNVKRQQLEREHQETHDAFMLILKRDQEAADRVLQQQQAEDKAREEAEQEKRAQEEKDEAERQRIADEQQKKEQAKQQRAVEAARKRDEETKAAAEEEAKKTEYIAKAKKRVAQLVELRASVAPFEKSKNVSRRRLKMKKIVKGKVNTLSQDANKIQTVANEVIQAIMQAKEEDEQLKQQIRAGNREISEEMIRGKRYLIDLLASDTMVRAQAEGFNGPRGDGFPLANMLAIVSTQVKELLPILAAHIYTVCPTAIPTLPKVTKNESEEELMESLGMAKGANGEYETFDRFLSRTEGIISLVADIMASNPPEHLLMGGQKGAIDFLERFLSHLPPAPETMPLLTAPVLDAFLTGAGHMLAIKYPDEFRKHLDVIMNDVVNRLDEGEIGAPSALRLKKVVAGGFESFKTNLPPKAIPSLYNGLGGGTSAATAPSALGSSGTTQTASAFGSSATTQASSSMPTPASHPFGGGQQQGSSTGAFTSSGSGVSTTSNPFGASAPSSSGGAPFGGSSPAPAAPTPFGGGAAQAAPSPFGQSSSSTAQPTTPFGGGFGQQQPTSSVGQQPSTNPSPFGQSGSSTGFGTQSNQSSTATASNPSPFGQQSGQAPFGTQSQPSSMQSGFGVSSSSSNAAPFGQQTNPSPFGNQTQSGMQTTSPSPFGQQSNASPFGSQSMGMNAPSPFGNVSSPFGAPSQSNPGSAFGTSSTPFGNQQNAPFGASQSTPFGSTQATPFGGNQSTPFGGGSQNTPFGGGNQGGPFGGPFGGGGNRNTSNKPPCKFFAQGTCRFGDKCRFSHDTAGNASGGAGGFGSNPFGGPRR